MNISNTSYYERGNGFDFKRDKKKYKMQKQTEIYMKQNHMVRPGDGILVGLSGGADSVGLLLVLWKLRETLQI